MPEPSDRPRPEDETAAAIPWLDRREIGKLLRLIGPLIQIPLIWLFLRDPDTARTRANWIYAGMTLGLALVLAGIVLSGRKAREP